MRPSRATGVPPAARIAEERARLRPLKIAPADLALRIPVSVSPMGVVMHDGHPYSMPPDAIGLPGTLYLYRERVRIVAGRFSAEHERQFEPGDGSILPEHRAQRVAAVSGKRARRYLQRQHLLDLGAAALAYLTELTHRPPARRGFTMSSGCTSSCRRTAMRRCAAPSSAASPSRRSAPSTSRTISATMPAARSTDEDRPPTIAASRLPRGGRVQVAEGARRGGAQRSTWTRPSTAARSRRVGGRS